MEEDGALDMDFDITLAQALKPKRRETSRVKKPYARTVEPPPPEENQELAQLSALDERPRDVTPPQIKVSEFDYSVENHFKAIDTIAKLCGYQEMIDVSQQEIERLSRSITFLREWKDFKYAPRVVKFACQRSLIEKTVIGGINLSQFSAAAVPKEAQSGSSISGLNSSNDFVCHVGGAVWALDWCPRVQSDFENHINCEFVAVAAHPPESSYHKIGAPLIGRGLVQIWCFLTACLKEDAPSLGNEKHKPKSQKKETAVASELAKRARGRPKKTQKANGLDKLPRPRGRPRKKALVPLAEKIHDTSQCIQCPIIEYPECSSEMNSGNARKHVSGEDPQKMHKESKKTVHTEVITSTTSEGTGNKVKGRKNKQTQNNGLHNLSHGDHGESSAVNPSASPSYNFDSMTPDQNVAILRSCDTFRCCIPEDVALPRMMLCLAHNGKTAWDVKWRPPSSTKSVNIMGYLAVLLGDGALEVHAFVMCANCHQRKDHCWWEVPLPQTVKFVYPAWDDCVDPRFLKLQPVFRCSMLKCGDRQSIPLVVEWSASSPHDMILAGCHGGVVALWKFSITDASTETRPLLSFSADTGPVKTLAWAPIQTSADSLEGPNIIATGSHRGIKFWDIRDPFRPVWDHPLQGGNTSLVWLPSPSCILGSIDDGTLWLFSLLKATCDIPVTGKTSPAPAKHGHNFDCSSFAIWSVQASQLTGMVAYCGADGTTLCFQLTTRSLNDPSRNRLPHYICGLLLEEGQELIVVSPMRDSPFSKRNPSMKRRSIPEKKAKDQSQKKQRLALCQGSFPDDEIEPGNSSMAIDKQFQKSTESCTNADKLEVENDEIMEVFPSKVCAMHRVRWNVNKGSEKWLCYGGAAGLVRFQEVDPSVFR